MSQHLVTLPIVSSFKPTHESVIAAEYHFYEACKAFCLSQAKRDNAEIVVFSDLQEAQEQLAVINLAAFTAKNKGVKAVVDAHCNEFQYRSCIFSLDHQSKVQYLCNSDSFVSDGIKVIDSVIDEDFEPSLVMLGA